MNIDLYIYYRARSENAQMLQAGVCAMQKTLSAEHGVDAALKRRPQEQDGRHTWMEVYLAVPAGFDAALERAVAQAGFAALIDGPRHTETFVDYSTCA